MEYMLRCRDVLSAEDRNNWGLVTALTLNIPTQFYGAGATALTPAHTCVNMTGAKPLDRI